MAQRYHDRKNFVELINNLQTREKVVSDLSEITMSSTSTVYRWISGQVIPPPIKQKHIADYFGKSVEELFPKKL